VRIFSVAFGLMAVIIETLVEFSTKRDHKRT
jgi:hypothetical protein